MINISWVMVVLCACLIYGLGAICLALNERIGRKQRIIEATEEAIEDLPICGSSKGLYLPETKAEIDEQICLHMKKVYSYWRKIKVLRDYKIDSDSVQKNLF